MHGPGVSEEINNEQESKILSWSRWTIHQEGRRNLIQSSPTDFLEKNKRDFFKPLLPT
jgi:hypothetical protein